jgi:hypothetical protein
VSILFDKVKYCHSMYVNDTIDHPIFGPMKVQTIFKLENNEFRVAVELQHFNNTVHLYDSMDLLRIKFGRRTVLRIVK